ncbi:hypothetical protein F3J44_16955 [Pantoea sp. Tr-811]|nr:hypothetical protein [Pantoea sp. Tr-811]
MKKIVPDPPLPNTTTRAFGRCDAGHEALFSVNPNICAARAALRELRSLLRLFRASYACGRRTRPPC